MRLLLRREELLPLLRRRWESVRLTPDGLRGRRTSELLMLRRRKGHSHHTHRHRLTRVHAQHRHGDELAERMRWAGEVRAGREGRWLLVLIDGLLGMLRLVLLRRRREVLLRWRREVLGLIGKGGELLLLSALRGRGLRLGWREAERLPRRVGCLLSASERLLSSSRLVQDREQAGGSCCPSRSLTSLLILALSSVVRSQTLTPASCSAVDGKVTPRGLERFDAPSLGCRRPKISGGGAGGGSDCRVLLLLVMFCPSVLLEMRIAEASALERGTPDHAAQRPHERLSLLLALLSTPLGVREHMRR